MTDTAERAPETPSPETLERVARLEEQTSSLVEVLAHRPPVPPALAAALVAAWAELGTLTKDKQAKIEGREGRASYSYTYADLADLLELARPVLAKHGLALLQPIERSGQGPVVIETWLLHLSGHMLSWRFEVAATGTPQAIGSSITYGRRYSAQAALGVAAEDDDDGAAASKAPPPAKAAAKKAAAKKAAPARTVTEALNRRMHALFNEAGQGGDEMRDTRLATAAAVIGRDITTSNEMNDDERRAVIEFLEGEVPPENDPGEGY